MKKRNLVLFKTNLSNCLILLVFSLSSFSCNQQELKVKGFVEDDEDENVTSQH